MALTLLDRIWKSHAVVPETADTPGVLYIDLHLVHEVTSPQAFDVLRSRGMRVRRPGRTLATIDHSVPTVAGTGPGGLPILTGPAGRQIAALQQNCAEFGIDLLDLESDSRGIVHVVGPELGATQPGMTIVCGDSHTSTHGAFGALAFGIGTSEVGHVLATQCVLQRRPESMRIRFTGDRAPGVSAKDLVLAMIRQIGVGGGKGSVLEYQGRAIEALSMEERMTVCNMSIEAGARAGMIAPDDVTFRYLKGRHRAPSGPAWQDAERRWRELRSDDDARFDREAVVDAAGVEPMITYGTNPGMCVGITGRIPDATDETTRSAMSYMGLRAGSQVAGLPVDVVFIGSCTNSRLSDLRAAADIMRSRRIAPGVRALVVPGSQRIKRQAEAEGLADVFIDAGAEWREPGCSMCIAMNGDQVDAGRYAVSTSNRNFEGRQGPGSRTMLASPATAAAAAVSGRVTDPRELTPCTAGAA